MHYLERVHSRTIHNIQRNYRAASSNVWQLRGRFLCTEDYAF